MGKEFRKYENKTGLYNKNENVHRLKQQVENKFYFCQTVLYTIILSLFGKKLDTFYDCERMDEKMERLRHTIYFHRAEFTQL